MNAADPEKFDAPNLDTDLPDDSDGDHDDDGVTAGAPLYRPVSRLAVSAFCLAVASLVVLVGPPITIVIPLAATAAAVAAIVYLRRARFLAGRRLANIALVTATAMLVAGPTFWLGRSWHMRRTATAVADMWIGDLHHGDLRHAHQMTLVPDVRFAPNRSLADRYLAFPQARTALGKFADEPVVAALRSHAGANYRFAAVEWNRTVQSEEWFSLRYERTHEEPSAEDVPHAPATPNADQLPELPDRPLFMIVKRLPNAHSQPQWMVMRYAFEPGAPM
jgi:hypothetical protein